MFFEDCPKVYTFPIKIFLLIIESWPIIKSSYLHYMLRNQTLLGEKVIIVPRSTNHSRQKNLHVAYIVLNFSTPNCKLNINLILLLTLILIDIYLWHYCCHSNNNACAYILMHDLFLKKLSIYYYIHISKWVDID